MTFGGMGGQFAHTNFLDGVTCQVHYNANSITLDHLEPSLNQGTIITIR